MKLKNIKYLAYKCFLKTLSFFIASLMLFTFVNPLPTNAQEIDTDDDRQALNDELMLVVPEETDNPNHTLSFSNPSTEKGVFISIDGATEKEITNPYTLPSLGIGEHTLSFKFTNAQDAEKNYEVSIAVLPRPPQILPPEKSDDGGILITGEATAGGSVYLFIAGEKSNYREKLEVSDNGKWEYLFLEDYDSSYYTAVAYTSKNGYGSEMSEPIIFTIELESDSIDENVPEPENEIVFSYKTLITKEFWSQYKENAEFLIFFVTVIFIGIFFGFVISRLVFGGKERSLEKNFQDALTGKKQLSSTVKETPLDRKARREEKKLLKQKEKEEKKREKELKKQERKQSGGSSLLNKLKKTKDDKNSTSRSEGKEDSSAGSADSISVNSDETQNITDTQVDCTEQEAEVTKSGTRIEPILDVERENYEVEMQTPPPADDTEYVKEEELNKTSMSDVESDKPQPEVTAMHVPVDEDKDEEFPLYKNEGDAEEGDSEQEEATGEEETTEQVENTSEEESTEQEVSSEDNTEAQVTNQEVEVDEGSVDPENAPIDPTNSEQQPVQDEAAKAKAIDKTDFLNKYKVHDPDPEGKDPLDLDLSDDQDLQIDKSENNTQTNPENDLGGTQEDESKLPELEDQEDDQVTNESQNMESDNEGGPERSDEEELDDVIDENVSDSSTEQTSQTTEESLQPKKSMAEKLFTVFKQEPKVESNELDPENATNEDQAQTEQTEVPEEKSDTPKKAKSVTKKKAKKTKTKRSKTTPKKGVKGRSTGKKTAKPKSSAKSKTSKKKATKPKRKKKPVASRKKNNIPPQLSGGLENVDW